MTDQLQRQWVEVDAALDALRLGLGDDPSGVPAEVVGRLALALEQLRSAQAGLPAEAEPAAMTRAATLRELRRYLELFAQAPDGYLVTTPEGIIREANQAASRLLQRAPEYLLRVPIFMFFHADNTWNVRTRVRHLAAGHGPVSFEARLRLPAEDPIEVECVVARGLDALTGQLTELRWRLTDIGARKLVERELRESRQMLRDLAARVEAVREDERARLAREVHDELGSALTALKMESAQTRRRMAQGDIPAVIASSETISGMADDMIRLVRTIASDLRPAVLDDFGLVAALDWLLQDFQTRSGIHTKLALEGESEPACAPVCATVLFRVLQELLTNVARHAQAQQVTVRLAQAAEEVQMVVRDDGLGIPEETAHRPTTLGLVGIRERVEQEGGTFEIRRTEPKGTQALVTVPAGRE